MQSSVLFVLAGVVAIVPAIAFTWRPNFQRTALFWAVLAVAAAGPLSVVFARAHGNWQADFESSLWVTVAATLVLFALCAAVMKSVWRLAPLLFVYMFLVALIAFAWRKEAVAPLPSDQIGIWLLVHILLAVSTYALATLAAVAALAAFIQERALKLKRKPILDGTLPSVTDCDRLIQRFLLIGEGILALGLISGIGTNLAAGRDALILDHKTVFTIGAFVIIGLLLIAQSQRGLRGRRAARGALLAYLLLTLGYPGVKFVTDILMQ